MVYFLVIDGRCILNLLCVPLMSYRVSFFDTCMFWGTRPIDNCLLAWEETSRARNHRSVLIGGDVALFVSLGVTRSDEVSRANQIKD